MELQNNTHVNRGVINSSLHGSKGMAEKEINTEPRDINDCGKHSDAEDLNLMPKPEGHDRGGLIDVIADILIGPPGPHHPPGPPPMPAPPPMPDPWHHGPGGPGGPGHGPGGPGGPGHGPGGPGGGFGHGPGHGPGGGFGHGPGGPGGPGHGPHF